MAHLWFLSRSHPDVADDVDRWTPRPLEAATPLGPSAHLLRTATPDGEHWVVVGPPSLRVNGAALATGIVALRDGDELCIDGERIFFSTETLARVVPFPGADRPILCARNKTEIAVGSPAVSCPICGVWHHQSEELACWRYADTCAGGCGHSTVDSRFRFDPEAL